MSDVAALIARLGSPDANDRMLALGELLPLGPAVGPGLLEVLRDPSAAGRALALEALVQLADPAWADDFARATEDPDEDVRALAAAGLGRLGDPRAAAALVRTIDDRQDVLRYPYTSSVYALIALGPSALPVVAPLLEAPDPVTRERAFLVVRSVVEARPDGADRVDWSALSHQLGSYDPRGEDQAAAAAQWREWIARRAADAGA